MVNEICLVVRSRYYLSKRDIKLFGRGIKLSEQVNYVVCTRYYVSG